MNETIFFDKIRQSVFGGKMSSSQVSGVNGIVDALSDWPIEWMAYGLATAFHETGQTMQPVHERGGNAYLNNLYDVTGSRPSLAKRMGNTTPGDGVKYAGRGYVQITWKINYRRFAVSLDLDLVDTPHLALRQDVSAKIMRLGMERGIFTGKKLGDYLSDTKTDYKGARRIINGTDKADLIAGYAAAFEAALRAAGYGSKAEFVTLKVTPITRKSRTAQGAGTAAAGGAVVTAEAIADVADKLQTADGYISAGTWLQVAVGVMIIAGAIYAIYARWTDGGGKLQWGKK